MESKNIYIEISQVIFCYPEQGIPEFKTGRQHILLQYTIHLFYSPYYILSENFRNCWSIPIIWLMTSRCPNLWAMSSILTNLFKSKLKYYSDFRFETWKMFGIHLLNLNVISESIMLINYDFPIILTEFCCLGSKLTLNIHFHTFPFIFNYSFLSERNCSW